MMGIVFTLLEEVVSGEHGEATWDSLLDAARLEGAYTAVGNYPDEELDRLVEAASSALKAPPDDIVRWFGRNSMPLLVKRYPEVFEGHETTRSFVLTLNDVIHPHVRKLFPGAYVPQFEFDASVDDQLTIGYRSHRRLCSFAEGLIEGAAEQFGDDVIIEQTECQKRGDGRCVLVCSFPRKVA